MIVNRHTKYVYLYITWWSIRCVISLGWLELSILFLFMVVLFRFFMLPFQNLFFYILICFLALFLCCVQIWTIKQYYCCLTGWLNFYFNSINSALRLPLLLVVSWSLSPFQKFLLNVIYQNLNIFIQLICLMLS